MGRRTGEKCREIPDEFFSELIRIILDRKIREKDRIQYLKIELCRKYHLSHIPGDSQVLEHIPKEHVHELTSILKLKPMRTASGVSPVAVMTSPADCPHGVCIYCPGGVSNDSPQSYTGHEPAALRAGSHMFDPFLQTESRLQQYTEIGHPTDKIDLIIMGGTFPARPYEYQDFFTRRCFDALNDKEAQDIKEAHILNETAVHRCIGLTIETRPDYCTTNEVQRMLALGATRVELGVQTTHQHILDGIHRGHSVDETIAATKFVKDAGMKVCYHMMPGLPGSTMDMDLDSFQEIFSNPDHRPDMLKIYPTLVVKGTELYDMWRNGDYTPLTTEAAVELLAQVKKLVPGYVRIQRIQRDIPAKLIEAGVKKSNIRQLARQRLDSMGGRCRCIRCRESGHTTREARDIELVEMNYKASGGMEYFISYEDIANEVLVAYLRLRLPGGRMRIINNRGTGYRNKLDATPDEEMKDEEEEGKVKDSEAGVEKIGDIMVKKMGEVAEVEKSEVEDVDYAMIRELRVSGIEVPIGEKDDAGLQHQGYGRKLVSRAEEIAREKGMERMLVTSGVGVRPYYRKLGYVLSVPYMEKIL